MAITHTTEIRYGTAGSYFSFYQMPTPFLSRSEENIYANGKWCQLTTISLAGSIVGRNYAGVGDTNARELNQDRDVILNGFSKDFQTLWVVEGGSTIIQFEGCTVGSISFSPANYGKQDYTIELQCYEQTTFKEWFGVTEPVNKVSFTEEEDGVIAISHEVSAVGFPTTGSYSNRTAIYNATDFVYARTGYSTATVLPAFVHNLSDSNLVLTDLSNNLDRAAGTCSFSANYKLQTGAIYGIPNSFVAGVINTVDMSMSSGSTDSFATIDINWKVQGGKDMSSTTLRSTKLPDTGTFYSSITGVYNNVQYIGAAGQSPFYYVPASYSVKDNADTDKSISISAQFNNDSQPWTAAGVFFNYNVSVNTDDVTDRATVSVDGEFIARGTFNNRFNAISGFYFNTIANSSMGTTGHLYDLANYWYTGVNYNMIYGNTAWELNPNYESVSVDMDELKGTIKLSASFNNNDYKMHFKQADWSITVTPSMNQFVAKPSCTLNGLYGIYNLNSATRASISWNLNFTPLVDGDYFSWNLPGRAYGPIDFASRIIHAYASDFYREVFNTLAYSDRVGGKQDTNTSNNPLNQLNFSESHNYRGLVFNL